MSPTTTTLPITTTTVDPARLPDPAVMEQLVRDYCLAWPDVVQYLAADIEFADVPADGWVPAGFPGELGFVQETDEATVRGRDDVDAALEATGFTKIDCGGPAVVSADWIALPVSASRVDGSGEECVWVLRIVDDRIGWHLAYGTNASVGSAASTEPNPVLVDEARRYCGSWEGAREGTGYRRDAQANLDAMSGDPAIHVIPSNLHFIGESGVGTDVRSYLNSDTVTCGNVTTNG